MIGGTDLAAILGVGERRTRFEVWLAKTGTVVSDNQMFAEEAEAGLFLEPLILRRFARRFSLRVDPSPATYRLRDRPFLGVNPDGFVYRTESIEPFGLIDAKTRSPYRRSAWGEAGSADAPPDEMCQMQWSMEILDLTIAYLAVFFDRRMEVFVLPRDRELGALMIEEATAFWKDYVLTRREPPFEGAAAAAYLRKKYPSALLPLRPATDNEWLLAEKREALKHYIEQRQLQLSAIEGEIKDRIGDAAGFVGDGFKATWGERIGRTTVDWKAVVAELRSFPVVADEAIATAIREQIDTAINRNSTVGEPTRALKISFDKGLRLLPTVELPALPEGSTEGENNGTEEPPA